MERFRQFLPADPAFYGRTLDWFLDHGWLALPILIACGFGVWFFFSALPFTLLPTGDSGVIRGALSCRKALLPQQQREMQDRLDPILQANPAVDKYFTIAGSGRAGSSGIFTVLFLKDQSERKPIEEVALEVRKAQQNSRDFATLNPQPVLQINIGATGSQFGRYSYSISGIDPDEVYAAADALGEKLKRLRWLRRAAALQSLPQPAQPRHRDRSRPRQHVRRLHHQAAEPDARRLFAKLRLSDQAAGRPISGHPRSRRCRPRTIREDLESALRSTRNGKDTLIPMRTMTKSRTRTRSASGQSPESIH